MVAVTVFAAMALAISSIMSRTNDAIVNNTRQATQNANARMALDYIAREFSQSIAASNIQFRYMTDGTTYDPAFTCHELLFAAFRETMPPFVTPTNREVVTVAYFVENSTTPFPFYSLKRASRPISASSAYSSVPLLDSPSLDETVELIRYVVEFRASCIDTNLNTMADGTAYNRLPLCMDLFLSVLSEADAKRADALKANPTTQKAYIDRNAKRYHTRCYSFNRSAFIQ
jgi:hypothetical protein